MSIHSTPLRIETQKGFWAPKRVTVYTSGTGTFTPLATNGLAIVQMLGGGGGGGYGNISGIDANRVGGGGGGGGQFLEMQVVLFDSSYAYAVGAGGTSTTAGSQTTLGPWSAAGGANGNGGVPDGGNGGGSDGTLDPVSTSAILVAGKHCMSIAGGGGGPGPSKNFIISRAHGQQAGAPFANNYLSPSNPWSWPRSGLCTASYYSGSGGGGGSPYGKGADGVGEGINGISATGYGAGGGGGGGKTAGSSPGGSGSGGLIVIIEYGAVT